jgi:beta-lactamase class A
MLAFSIVTAMNTALHHRLNHTSCRSRRRGSRGAWRPPVLVASLVAVALALPVFTHPVRAASGSRRTADPPDAAALATQPLAALSPAAAQYLTTRAGRVAVAVAVPARGRMYTAHGSDPYPLLSVAKVSILFTLLQQSEQAGRLPSQHDLQLLEAMLEASSNDAASRLWTELGGHPAVQRAMGRLGVRSFQAGSDPHWGTSTASATDVAQLLTGLATGTLLDPERQALALVLMSRVDASQRWGVTAGAPAGALLAFKNGWEEGATGRWTLHSAGLVLPGSTGQAYSIVVLTDGQPSLQYGLATIQTLASLLHASVTAVTGAGNDRRTGRAVSSGDAVGRTTIAADLPRWERHGDAQRAQM